MGWSFVPWVEACLFVVSGVLSPKVALSLRCFHVSVIVIAGAPPVPRRTDRRMSLMRALPGFSASLVQH